MWNLAQISWKIDILPITPKLKLASKNSFANNVPHMIVVSAAHQFRFYLFNSVKDRFSFQIS